MYVFLLVALSTVASIVTMTAWGLDPIAIDASSAGMLTALLLLLGMALIAASCADLKSVLLMLAVVLGLNVVASFTLNVLPHELARGIWRSLAVIVAASAAALLTRRYRDRRRSVAGRSATMGGGIAVMLFPAFIAPATTSVVNAGVDAVTLSMPLAGELRCERGSLVVPVRTIAPIGWRVGLMTPTLTVDLIDGTTLSLAAPAWFQLVGSNGPMLPTQRDRRAWRVLGGDGDAADRLVRIAFPMTPADSGRACDRISRLRMTVSVTTTTGEEVLRVRYRVHRRTAEQCSRYPGRFIRWQ